MNHDRDLSTRGARAAARAARAWMVSDHAVNGALQIHRGELGVAQNAIDEAIRNARVLAFYLGSVAASEAQRQLVAPTLLSDVPLPLEPAQWSSVGLARHRVHQGLDHLVGAGCLVRRPGAVGLSPNILRDHDLGSRVHWGALVGALHGCATPSSAWSAWSVLTLLFQEWSSADDIVTLSLADIAHRLGYSDSWARNAIHHLHESGACVVQSRMGAATRFALSPSILLPAGGGTVLAMPGAWRGDRPTETPPAAVGPMAAEPPATIARSASPPSVATEDPQRDALPVPRAASGDEVARENVIPLAPRALALLSPNVAADNHSLLELVLPNGPTIRLRAEDVIDLSQRDNDGRIVVALHVGGARIVLRPV